MATQSSTISLKPSIIDADDFVYQRRCGNRQPLSTPATLFDEAAAFLSPGIIVQVTNISLAGVGFNSDRPTAVGSTCRIHLANGIMRLNSRIRVTRCNRHRGEYDIGAEFIED
jgi:hypothetical protein